MPADNPAQPPMAHPPVIFCQDGARLHYAIPMALRRAGLLRALYTDWYCDGSPRGRVALAMMRWVSPKNARRLEQRRCQELAGVPVYCLRLTGPLFIWACRARSSILRLIVGPWWQSLARRGPLAHPRGEGTVYFTFAHNLSLGTARELRARGYRVVIDQPIAAMVEAVKQRRLGLERWPGWEPLTPLPDIPKGDPDVQQLGPLANHWTCASDYVRDSLVEVGISPEKISVIPYPVDVRDFKTADRSGRTGPATVGFVGQVNLRKGAPWFLEVARRLRSTQIRMVMVGPIAISDTARRELALLVELTGSVTRSEVYSWLAKFDIFLFPSTCEGSAGAVMEAMATGLPIVATPNAGSIVRDGVEGFIRPYDRPDELAACVQRLVADQGLRLDMGRSARKWAEAHDIDAYSVKIAALMRRVLADPAGAETESSHPRAGKNDGRP